MGHQNPNQATPLSKVPRGSGLVTRLKGEPEVGVTAGDTEWAGADEAIEQRHRAGDQAGPRGRVPSIRQMLGGFKCGP